MTPDNYDECGDQDEIEQEYNGEDINPLAILTEQPSDPLNDTEVD